MGIPQFAEPVSASKTQWRKYAKAKRQGLDSEFIGRASDSLCQRLQQQLADNPQWQNWAVFYPQATEPQLWPFYRQLQKENKTLSFPRCFGGGAMDFFVVDQALAEASFVSARYALMEPSSERLMPAEQVDCILVPGLLFDTSANRLGHGAGYFDRYLQRCKAVRLAVAFSAQVTEQDLPRDPYDQCMDYLFTETTVYSWERKES